MRLKDKVCYPLLGIYQFNIDGSWWDVSCEDYFAYERGDKLPKYFLEVRVKNGW